MSANPGGGDYQPEGKVERPSLPEPTDIPNPDAANYPVSFVEAATDPNDLKARLSALERDMAAVKAWIGWSK